MTSLSQNTKYKEEIWKRPVIVPKPSYVSAVQTPVKSLNSDAGVLWQFGVGANSIEDAMEVEHGAISWNDIIVPGEPAMQGYDIDNDIPYYYKAIVSIPLDYAGNNIILRFNGVYSRASVWVNGTYIRSHKGGFTTWDCDITQNVTPGEEAVVIVEFIDVILDPSIGSFYAHHNMGGIINSVELLAVPLTHLTRLHYEVDFDQAFINAELKISLGVALGAAREASVQLELMDMHNCSVPLDHSHIRFAANEEEQEIICLINSPEKWDAEHPDLYTLQVKLYNEEQSEMLQTCHVKVGFRKITYGGMDGTDKRELYINGQRIKLRGTCRHHVHPTLGRTTTPAMDRYDVELLKGQNVNYVRTSHYPPTKAFLEACDELGMYVEEETAVNFQYANTLGPWPDDEEWYMDQFAEMIERDQSHPSVIIWSLANECSWLKGPEGDKFRRQYQYIKQADTSRPSKFSYPFFVEDGTVTDIYSVHYANYTDSPVAYRTGYGEENFTGKDFGTPVLHDEYAHIACYNLNELDRDNNVRNFWGESIKKFWEGIVRTDGALGGALWANIDDVFQIPDGVKKRHQEHTAGSATGYGEWGNMSDQWRREKPEYWLTKKAYSPVRVADQPLGNPGNSELIIPIDNWFNHTNLCEVQVMWSIKLNNQVIKEGQMFGPDVAPYEQGVIVLPKREWQDQESVGLRFITPDGIQVEEYELPIKAREIVFSEEPQGKFEVVETDEHIQIRNQTVELVYCKQTAQIEKAAYQGRVLMTGGPHLHLQGEDLGCWKSESIHAVNMDLGERVEVTIVGQYKHGMKVKFVQTLQNDGELVTHYKLLEGTVSDKLSEVGIAFTLHESITEVEWEKDGLYSVYPNHHIGRLKGSADRIRKNAANNPDTYRNKPNWDWKDDMRNFFMEDKEDQTKGLVTKDFNTMREYIYFYSARFEDTDARIRVESQGTEAARVRYEYKKAMINDSDTDQISYIGDWQSGKDSKCIFGTQTLSNQPGAKAVLTFEGTGVRLIYKKERISGEMLVSIDNGNFERMDTHSDIGMTLYQQVYEVKDLPFGKHTITVEVPNNNKDSYVVIDAFEVLDTNKVEEMKVSLIVNNAWRYSDLVWGNYLGPVIELAEGYENQITLRFTDHN